MGRRLPGLYLLTLGLLFLLFKAALSGNVGMCEFLHSRGLDVKLLNHNGHSAVHKAAVKGQVDVCKWLLTTGGLTKLQLQPDQDCNTPSRMARCEGFVDLADWLSVQEQQQTLP